MRIPIRVKPGAKRPKVGGTYPGPYGDALVIAVKERAVDGAATEASWRALAKALGVPASAVMLRRGATSRDKVFEIDSIR